MLRSLIIFCATALTFTPAALAQTYDDPAVAACEFILHEGKAPPQGYKRTGAEIKGLQVTISYAIEVLNVAPRSRSHTCLYKVDEAGNFTHDLPDPPEILECKATFATVEGTLATLSGEARADAIAKVQECQGIVTAFATKRVSDLTQIYVPLSEMDLMTLPAEETSLSSDGN